MRFKSKHLCYILARALLQMANPDSVSGLLRHMPLINTVSYLKKWEHKVEQHLRKVHQS